MLLNHQNIKPLCPSLGGSFGHARHNSKSNVSASHCLLMRKITSGLDFTYILNENFWFGIIGLVQLCEGDPWQINHILPEC